MAKSFLFILNPASGGKEDRRQIIKKLEEGLPGVDLIVRETSGRDDLSMIQKEAGRKHWDALLVGGGDGTINLVAPVIIGHQLPLGIIPLGSANGLAACLGIPEVDKALEAIRSGNLETIDAIKMNGKRCLHMSDFGFNAGLIKRFDRSNERGMMSYFKSSLGEFLEMRPYRFVIQSRDLSEEIEAKILVMANGDRYGTGAIINPWGRMNDGLLEIIALNPEGLDEMISLSVSLFRGTLEELPGVKQWSVQSATIHNPDGATFQIDGEVMEDTRMVKIVCEPGPLRVFAPERK
ncbi:MAG: diacylglycerol kinase family lipid kinase [Bacteroidales bacterium]